MSVLRERYAWCLLVCGSKRWTSVAAQQRAVDEILALSPRGLVRAKAAGAAKCAELAAQQPGSTVNGLETYHPWRRRDGVKADLRNNARMLRRSRAGRGIAFGALWERSAAGRWRHTLTGNMVSLLVRAGLPVRWIATPAAQAVDLVSMPKPGPVAA